MDTLKIEELPDSLLKFYMDHHCKIYNRLKTELIRRGGFERKQKRVSDVDILNIICSSKTKKEALERCYPETKDHGGGQYNRVNKMCKKYGINLN